MRWSRVICQSVSRKFIRLSMETPYLCFSEGHKYGGCISQKTSETQLCYVSGYSSLVGSSVPSYKHHFIRLKCSNCLKPKGDALFSNKTFFYGAQLGVTCGRELENEKCALFQNEGHYRSEYLPRDKR